MPRYLLLLLIAVAFSIDIWANHIAGGYITYTHVAGNTYEVTLIRDRDPCMTPPGPQLPPSETITVRNMVNNTSQNYSLPRVSFNGNVPIPPTNPCLIPPSNSCMEQAVYKGNVTLANGSDYTIFYQGFSRNLTINVVSGTTTGQTLTAEVPNPSTYPGNSGPNWVSDPPVMICLNQPLNYDNSATDPNADSLAYYFCNGFNNTPANPPFNPINWANPYNVTYQIASAPAFAIHPVTGLLTGTPNLSGRWLLVVCVDEFRNGVKIGTYRRETQLQVTLCTQQATANLGIDYFSDPLGIEVIASCDDYTVTFNNTSTAGTAGNYFWDFGVPGITTDTSTAFQPTYTYPDTGTFIVTLISNPGTNCADTIQRTVIVYPIISAGFDITTSPLCHGTTAPYNIHFQDTSYVTYGSISWWAWNFGATGVNPSGQSNPVRTYPAPGTYNVRLIVQSNKGCRDTIIKPITINQTPTVSAGTGTVRICRGDSTVIQASGNAVSWLWTPSTGLSCVTCLQPTASPTTTTFYTLTGTSAEGCERTSSVIVQVLNTPTVSAGPDKFICGTGSVQLEGSVTNATSGYTVNWSPATGLNNANVLNPTASPTATTTYILTVTTNTNPQCIVRDTMTVYLDAVQVNAGGPRDTICPGSTLQLQATTPVSNPTISWSPSATLSSSTIMNPVASPTNTTTYTIQITDPVSGCSGTDTIRVIVNALPQISAGNDTVICTNTQAALQASGGVSYIWTSNPSLSCTSCPSPFASPTSTTRYYVTGVDNIGCSNTDSVLITVVSPATLNITADTIICVNTSAQLNASGAVSYQWTPASTLNNSSIPNPLASPLVATTYTVAAIDVNGCNTSATVNISLQQLPVVGAGNDVSICFGDTTQLSANGATTYSWTPNVNIQGANTANPLVWPTATTTYTVTGTDAIGCSNTDVVTVTVNTLAAGGFSPDTAICVGGSAQLFASGFNQYSWSPGGTLSNPNIANPVATPTTTTQYTVVVTDLNGCVDSTQIRVTVNPLPLIAAGSAQTICRGDSVQITASINNALSYQWTPGASLSNPNTQSPFAKPVTTTTYTVTATDVSQCQNTATVTVNVNQLPVITTSPDVVICDGDTTQITASGGVSYLWTPNTNLSNPNISNPLAYPDFNQIYTVAVTDANGCINRDSVLVQVNKLQAGNFSPDGAICIGQSYQLFANGFVNYQWSPAGSLNNANISNPLATPTSTTIYTVIVEDANNCIDTGTVTVTVNPLPIPSISAVPDSICLNSSTTIVAAGGISYDWAPTSGLSCTNCPVTVASPLVTTIYTVVVTDGNGCQNDITQRIQVLPLPVISKSADTYVCRYDSTRLQVSGGVSYNWTPGNSLDCTTCPNPWAFPLITTRYTVQVTDQYGCINRDSILVTVNSAAGNVSPDTAICLNGSAQLQIGGGIQYNWWPSTGLSCTNCPNPVASPANTTIYSVQVTDANGCRDTAGVTVSVNPLPVVSAGSDVTICQMQSTQLQATAPTAVSFAWLPVTGLSNSAISNPIATPLTTTSYIVRVVDNNTCENRDTVEVTVLPLPTTNAGNDVAICFGDTVQLAATGASNYAWSPSTSLSCVNCPDPLAFPTTTTVYVVIGTHSNGCTLNDTIRVTVNPLPVVTASPATAVICVGDQIPLMATGGATYQWSPTASLSNATIANPVATPATSTIYTVRAFTTFGCFADATADITVNPPANITITADTTVCPGERVQLSASGGVTYTWTPPAGLSNPGIPNPIATPAITTQYFLRAVDASGCVIDRDVTIGIFIPADPQAGVDAIICFGETAPLIASNGVTYQWAPTGSLVDATSASTIAEPTVTTTYTVSIVDANGCPNTDEVTITVIQLPLVDAGPDQSMYEGSRVRLEGKGAVTYHWTPEQWLSDPFASLTYAFPPDTTMFYLVGTDGFGCQGFDSVRVLILPKPVFYLPNAFSPNGDGMNDEFVISHHKNFNLVSLKVFNRWGELVFETSDIGRGWDGRSSDGAPLPIATYVYTVEGTDDIGLPLVRKGNLTLIR